MNNLVGDVKANPRDFYRYIIVKKDWQYISPLKKKWREGWGGRQGRGNGVAELDRKGRGTNCGQFMMLSIKLTTMRFT